MRSSTGGPAPGPESPGLPLWGRSSSLPSHPTASNIIRELRFTAPEVGKQVEASKYDHLSIVRSFDWKPPEPGMNRHHRSLAKEEQ